MLTKGPEDRYDVNTKAETYPNCSASIEEAPEGLLPKKPRRVQPLGRTFSHYKAQKFLSLAVFIVGFILSINNTPSKNMAMFVIGGLLTFVGIGWGIAVFLAS